MSDGDGYLPIENFEGTDCDKSSRPHHPHPSGKFPYKLDIFPKSLNFGNLRQGLTSQPQSLLIVNEGYNDLIINDVVTVGPFRIIGEKPEFIKTGEIANLQVVFTPEKSGFVTGGIYFDSHDNGGKAFIQLSGLGAWATDPKLDVPVIPAHNDGQGTGNIITAYTNEPIPEGNGKVLISLDIQETNTDTPVTVSFNDNLPLIIKDANGDNVEVGSLTPGMVVLGVRLGSTFRLLTDIADPEKELPVLSTIPDDLSLVPSPFLLQSGTGLQMWIHDGSEASIVTWLGGKEPYTTLTTPDMLKNIGVNDTLLSGGFTGVRTVTEELNDNFGMPKGLLPQAATDVGTMLLMPPTEESTNYVHPMVPWMSYRGNTIRVIPLDIRTILHNTPVGLPLFRPVITNGWGFLIWEYIGKEPMHVLLEGTIELLMRTAAVTPSAHVRTIMELRAWDTPLLEDGQNSGRRYLASNMGVLTPPAQFFSYEGFNDRCAPVTQRVIDGVGTFPNLFEGSDNGFFNPGDDTEELRQGDSDGPIGPQVRTTKWIDLADWPPNIRCFFFDFDGTSTRGRMQVKREDGSIYTYSPMSQDITARRVYRAPLDARWIRIYYSSRNDTASNESFRPLLNGVSADYDPLKGYWEKASYSVKRDVVFWPGAKYALTFNNTAYDGAAIRDWGFRFTGGGLSFNFDAGPMRKALSSKLNVGLS